MGVDEGILLCGREFAGSDTWATSYALSLAIKKIGDFDVVLFGKQASDGDTAQVGPGVATHLGVPQITYVRRIEEMDEKRVVAERLLENGFESVEAPLPCVLTVVKEINEPRLPSLKGKMRAKKAEIPVWGAAEINADPAKIGTEGSPTKVVRIFTPSAREGGEIFSGDPREAVLKLAAAVKDIVVAANA